MCVSFCIETNLMRYTGCTLYVFGACESELCPLNGPYFDSPSIYHYYVYSVWLESKLPLLIGGSHLYTKYYVNYTYITVGCDADGLYSIYNI